MKQWIEDVYLEYVVSKSLGLFMFGIYPGRIGKIECFGERILFYDDSGGCIKEETLQEFIDRRGMK